MEQKINESINLIHKKIQNDHQIVLEFIKENIREEHSHPELFEQIEKLNSKIRDITEKITLMN